MAGQAPSEGRSGVQGGLEFLRAGWVACAATTAGSSLYFLQCRELILCLHQLQA